MSAQALPDTGKYRGDNLSMTFTFPDGSIGVVDYLANGDKSFPKERLEVFCGGDVAVLDDFRTLETVRAESGRLKGKRRIKAGLANGWRLWAPSIQAASRPSRTSTWSG